jgi:splicing factor 3B subunit 1
MATPTPMGGQTPGFKMLDTPAREEYGIPATQSETGMPHIKPEDMQYFGKLMDEVDETMLDPEAARERYALHFCL